MRVRIAKRRLVDNLIEIVGIKSGLLLTPERLASILDSKFHLVEEVSFLLREPQRWWSYEDDDVIVVRGEELEADFILLLNGVGAIPDLRPQQQLIVEYIRNNAPDLGLGSEAVGNVYQKAIQIQRALIEEDEKSYFEAVNNIPGSDLFLQELRRRNPLDRSFPQVRQWDGFLPLEHLFESEQIVTNTPQDAYFDQRFIDYLNAQPQDLTSMHWRQFEYLAGEYFKRNGYKVTITPARGDGGSDVVAEKQAEVIGPELILVQCKRYKEANTVKIEEVKAFWATICDEGATKGLVVTTSKLEKGARDYCEAKKYQFAYAEYQNVVGWLNLLATYRQQRV